MALINAEVIAKDYESLLGKNYFLNDPRSLPGGIYAADMRAENLQEDLFRMCLTLTSTIL